MKVQTLIGSAIVCALGVAASARAQDSTVYAVFDYMKVPAQKTADYLAVERAWKKIHQKRLERGLITAWYFYRVENPELEARNYQYVTVNVYDSFAKLEKPFPDDLFSSVYSAEELEKYMKLTGESRDLIRSEVWHLEAMAMKEAESSGNPPPQLLVHFMQPLDGKEGRYVQMELQIFQKLHQERINRKLQEGWFFLSRMFPGGSEVPYSYATVNVFPGNVKANQWPDDLVKSVFPDTDMSKWPSPNDLRKMVKEDVWKPIDRVTK